MPEKNLSYQPLETQREIQSQELKKQLDFVSQHSPFYKRMFGENKVSISEINSVSDLPLLPTTCKEDLQQHNNDFICVPKSEIIEYTATSGTLGSPVHIALTASDLDRLAYNEYLSFELMGITSEDTVQLMLTLDRQFMAGMAYYSGLKKMNASIVRTGPGLPPMQLDTILKLNSTVLIAVPSFLLKLIEYCEKINVDINSLPVKKILCIGENIRDEKLKLNALASHITSKWHVELFSTYASTEMQTAFTECTHQQGGHNQPDLLIVEILNSEGKQAAPGEYGEVTVTTIGVQAMPLIRFRTGDIACLYESPCACGRKSVRISPLAGRKKQMIKYKGTTLYPATIFDLLNHFAHIKDYVVEVNSDSFDTDELTLHISIDIPIDECEQLLKPFLQSRLRIIPKINYLSTTEVLSMQYPDNNRKPVKFLDNRK